MWRPSARVDFTPRTAVSGWHSVGPRADARSQLTSAIQKTRHVAKKAAASSDSESGNDETDGHRLNKIYRQPKGSSKEYFVYVRKDGKVHKVSFGDPHMANHEDNDERRKNFRARHGCSEKKDRTSAGYWACKVWTKGGGV